MVEWVGVGVGVGLDYDAAKPGSSFEQGGWGMRQ